MMPLMGILGFSFIIFKAISFIASLLQRTYCLIFLMPHQKQDQQLLECMDQFNNRFNLKSFFPCIITVVFPSGIFKTLNIFATVPTPYIFSMPGFSSLMFL